jgi:hypothetical protein
MIAKYKPNGKIGTIIFSDEDDIEIVTENLEQYIDRHSEFEIIDVDRLLSRLQIAEEALKNIVETVKERELERIFVPNIRYSIEITKIADTALQQFGE